MKYEFISIDLQKGFTENEGRHFKPRASVLFVKETLIPFLEEKNILINEIISDYRYPRLNLKASDTPDHCVPGLWGYESIVPSSMVKSTWVKCMNSPIWIRDGIGDPNRTPGLPKQDPEGFSSWLSENIGDSKDKTIILFGLTVDCCVLSTAQELSWRGYKVLVLKEGVDHYTGLAEDKEAVLKNTIFNWSKVIEWEELKNLLV